MSLRHCAQLICALTLLTSCLFGQTVSSSLVGTVLDPSNAVVPNAAVTLTDQETGAVRASNTDSSGTFRFLNLTPGEYSLSVTVTGFKSISEKGIALAAQETRDVGRLTLSLGSTTDTIAITAEATPIQLASAEKSQAIDGKQLNDITLKGRDLFGYLKLVPGVIDTTAARDVTSPNAIAGITINGLPILYGSPSLESYYRTEVIGEVIDLETMTRDYLYNHYKRNYIPNNATAVLVGDGEPNAFPLTKESAIAHAAVVGSVLDKTTSLPFRFGTIISEQQLRHYVTTYKPALEAGRVLVS